MSTHKEPEGGFWPYDTTHEPRLNIPSSEELVNAWQKLHEANEMATLRSGTLGAFELPSVNRLPYYRLIFAKSCVKQAYRSLG